MDLEKKIAQAVKGDKEAFSNIIKLKKEDLYRTAYAFVKNKDDALDILQETVYKAYISIGKLKKPQYFNTWLTRILINNCKDFIKSKEKVIYLEEIHDMSSLKNSIIIPKEIGLAIEQGIEKGERYRNKNNKPKLDKHIIKAALLVIVFTITIFISKPNITKVIKEVGRIVNLFSS